jgi:16S rRNA (adenine1518-N6/adenine1519-N6)-dimethyltransferase
MPRERLLKTTPQFPTGGKGSSPGHSGTGRPPFPRIRPRKSLGQNFLRDENIVRKIVDAIDPHPDDALLEIGPGEGALTRHLAGRSASLTVVDVDPRAAAAMREMFPGGDVAVVEGDILEMDLGVLSARRGRKLRVAGNIPYNITSPILFHVIENRAHVEDMTLMVQKEVARRMAAGPGSEDYGILSVFCGYFAETSLLFDVSANAFFPRPKVTSAVIRFRMRDFPGARASDENFFRAMVRAAFGKRRKTLRNSLGYFAEAERFRLPDLPVFARRPEELAIAELVGLANTLHTLLPDHDTGHE